MIPAAVAQLTATLPLADGARDVLVASIAAARTVPQAPAAAALLEKTARAVLTDRVPAVGIAGFARQGPRRLPFAFVGRPLYGQYDFAGAAERGQPLHVPLLLTGASGAVATGRHLIVFAGGVSFELIDVWLWRAHRALPWLATRCTPHLADVARTLLHDRASLLTAVLESITGHEAGHAPEVTLSQGAPAAEGAASDLAADAAASAVMSDAALCCTTAYHVWNVARARSFADEGHPVVQAAVADADALAGSLLLALLFPDGQPLSAIAMRRAFAGLPAAVERLLSPNERRAVTPLVARACRQVRDLDASAGPAAVAPRPVQEALDAIARMVAE
ncbi:MAG TPA: hypothetical protein VEO54_11120 [Thermoanaerobaculia bacterium]|nr:hypothetical protein [Thermoanaerobaculia bacterium]